jgi:CHASE2 domain-containing sensor protein
MREGIWLRTRARKLVNILWIVCLLAVAVYFESPRKQSPDSKCELSENGGIDEKSASQYVSLVSVGNPDIRSRRVTVIYLREAEDSAKVINNVCEQRWYLSRLVETLAADGATAIVFDKFFGSDSCVANDQGTKDLISAVQTSRIPVIVGVATHTPALDKQNVCLIVSESLDFGSKKDANGQPSSEPAVRVGFTRSNNDPRKIPINWYAYDSDHAFAAHEPPADRIPTLSYAAATLVDKGLSSESRLRKLRMAGQHPFTSFILPENLSQTTALNVLCNGPHRAEIIARYGTNGCLKRAPSDEIFGKIILVGEDVSGKDRHQLLGHEVAGAYLQANYIESLLDSRYLRPAGAAWDFALFAGWLIFLYVIFWIQPEVALVVSVLMGLCVKFAIVQIVVFYKVYPDVWVQQLGVIALVLRYVDARGHRLVAYFEKSKEKAGLVVGS